jgi:hypothetical protein
MTTASTSRLTLASVVLIAILLTVLGILQYRWVGELSEFEGERMRRNLPAAAERLRNDFTRELDDIWRIFSARRGEHVPAAFVAAYREWMASAPLPELIDAVFWASAEPDSSELSRFDPRLSQNRAIVLLNRAVLFERAIPARLRE